MTEKLTLESFKEKIFDFEQNQEWNYKGEKPCVIDFYADWCGPCKMLSPIIDQLNEEYKDEVKFYKVDTEDQQELAAMFGIQSIPTLVFCPTDGSEPQIAQGAYPKPNLIEIIEQVFGVQKPE